MLKQRDERGRKKTPKWTWRCGGRLPACSDRELRRWLRTAGGEQGERRVPQAPQVKQQRPRQPAGGSAGRHGSRIQPFSSRPEGLGLLPPTGSPGGSRGATSLGFLKRRPLWVNELSGERLKRWWHRKGILQVRIKGAISYSCGDRTGKDRENLFLTICTHSLY